MQGKILFVVGLGVGYLLGTRAGRRRYEQIKTTALNLWESEPVQWGVSQVQDAAGDLADQAIAKAKSVIAQAQGKPQKSAPAGSTKPRATAGARSSSSPRPTATTEKRAATRPQPKPASPMAEPSARSGVATGAIPVIPTKPAE